MSLPIELVQEQDRIERFARGYGLDFYRTVFEMVDYQQMNMLAAYGGFPTRYPHWRWGMEYYQLSKSYEYGLHRIYEMVINNDPTYAYLLEGNTMLDQKLVMAHVYGHADFFKTNLYFAHTSRKMVDEMANHATRIRRYHERFGVERVERFVDACLAGDDLIDPNAVFRKQRPAAPREDVGPDESVARIPTKSYMDRYVNPPEYLEEQKRKKQERVSAERRFPPSPERDVLGFVLQHAPLENWERDVLGMIREEAYYFLPQRQTKVMNEGWASYWHTTIMTNDVLSDAEVIDYADRHSGTVATSPGQLNPYKLGLELFRDIERRWDLGQYGPEWESCDDMAERASWKRPAEPGAGRAKMFEVRRLFCDVTFLDAFLTPEFCIEQRLFTHDPRGDGRVVPTSREFSEIKQALLFHFTNGGRPVIEVIDGNYGNRGELLLAHRHLGVDLRLDWAKEVLEQLVRLWKRPVHIETLVKGKPTRLGHDGDKPVEQANEKSA